MDDGTTTHRRALSYIDASREFYAAHGYERPYRWAVHDEVPFTPLPDLTGANVAVVTTSFPLEAAQPKRTMAVASAPTPDAMFTDDLSWHKEATHTDDVNSFLPLDDLRAAAADGTIGRLNERFFCVPTLYSRRRTLEAAERVAEWCREDDVDLVLLVPL